MIFSLLAGTLPAATQRNNESGAMSLIPANPESTSDMESPGLGARLGFGPAFELKFQVTEVEAQALESWARSQLTPDAHGDDGRYHVTSVYCDTPQLDMFHRTPGFKRSKYRLRRYGGMPVIFLERKTKRGERVRKKRAEIPEEDLGLLLNGTPQPTWVAAWYYERIHRKVLRPTCAVAYWRTAFFGRRTDSGPIRMTFDRDLIGAVNDRWSVPNLHEGQPLLPGGVLVELKYHISLPALFRDLLPQLPPQPARVSKYRLGVQLCGVKPSAAAGLNGSANGGLHLDGR